MQANIHFAVDSKLGAKFGGVMRHAEVVCEDNEANTITVCPDLALYPFCDEQMVIPYTETVWFEYLEGPKQQR
jgi:hypothetical protein